MTNRLSRLIACFKILEIDAFFVSNPVNIRYLTGYKAEDAWLLVTASETFYITDFRYVEHASRALGKLAKVVQFKESLFQTAVDLARGASVKRWGVEEEHLTYQAFNRLKSFCRKDIRLKPLSGVVESLRIVKDADELKLIRAAVAVNLEGFDYIRPYIKPGITEQDVLNRLEIFSKKSGAAFSFPPIIASGPNSAYPHAKVTDRRLRPGEPLLLDFGLEWEGYKSDLTRMFFLGKIQPSFMKVLSIIREAQEAAFRVLRAGIRASQVDAAARDFLAKKGLTDQFGHSLGHGVGLNVHEMPRLSAKSGVVLSENMIVTVEPGVYFPGRYGVRQEEMVLVTKNGCEVLSGDRNY